VDAAAGERVEDDGQGARERLALARLHLGDVAAVEHHAADELHVEVTHAHDPLGRLARQREGLRERLLEREPLLLHAALELGEALAQLLVALELELGLEGGDQPDALLVGLELLGLAQVQGAIEDPHSFGG
jgi:hypothetical protein